MKGEDKYDAICAKTIAKLVRAHRRALGKSATYIANKSGVSASWIWEIEGGSRPLKGYVKFTRMMAALGLDIRSIVNHTRWEIEKEIRQKREQANEANQREL